MSRHQVVNMRGRGLPMVFGDNATREAYERELQAALAAQRVQFAVAPRIRLPLPNGTGFLESGSEVRLAQLAGGPLAPQLVLNRWLASGHVIEADGFDDGPRAA
jgi:hypothetical protein